MRLRSQLAAIAATLAIVSVLVINSPAVPAEYQVLYNTDHCFGHCETILRLRFSSNYSLSDQRIPRLEILQKSGLRNATASGIDVLVQHWRNIQVPQYGNCTQMVRDNITSSSSYFNYTCIKSYVTQREYYDVWEQLDYRAFKFKKSSWEYVKMWADFKPALGENSVESSFYIGQSLVMDPFWNTSCSARWPVLAPISSQYAITYLNGSSGINGAGNIYTWENATGAYVYNCTYGSTPYFPVANSVKQLNWENGTRNAGNNFTGGYNESGLLGFWKFDDSVAWKNDSTQWGQNLTVSGNVAFNSADCKYGTCADLDGADDALKNTTRATNFIFTSAGNFTICVWAKQDATGALRNLARMDANVANRNMWLLRINDANKADFTIYCGVAASCGGSTWAATALSTRLITTTTSYVHVCGAYNGSAVSVYINGTFEAAATATATFTTTESCLLFGADRGCGTAFTEEFNGRIDDARIYNRALALAEIYEIYANDVTLGPAETQAADTCGCPASGDWRIECSDNCTIAAACNMHGNNVVVNGSAGNYTLNAEIYNYTVAETYNCSGLCNSTGGCWGQ
jgi:hypothetical protein